MLIEDKNDDGEVEEIVIDEGKGADKDSAKADEGDNEDEGGDELVVTIGGDDEGEEDEEDEGDSEKSRDLIRKLRRENRKKAKRLKELEKATEKKPEAAPTLRAKPALDKAKNAEEFTADLDKWYAEKAEYDKAKSAQEAENKKVVEAWNGKVEKYSKDKESLGVDDFDDAESAVEETFNTTQQGIIMSGATNASLLIYALGKNPKKAAELAAITDPVEFSFAAARLEMQLKTSTRKRAPNPDKAVPGRTGGATDKTLESLEKEADRTGDRSKIIAYKRSLKNKG